MTEETYDPSWFQLVTSTSSPKTGIKISVSTTEYYEAQSTFRFTGAVNSKEAKLSDLIVSTGTINEENPEESTYKKYTLTPEFEKNTTSYELELREYIDNMDITAIKTDEKSTLKIKVPQKDDKGNLVYEEDGTTISYEEKDMQSGTPLNVILNKLGEPNTVITVTVMAEDGKTSEKYEINIKRPFATIKGQAILADFDNEMSVQNFLDNYGIQVNNRVDINLYKPDLAEWESISDIYQLQYKNPLTYEKLESIPKETTGKSNDDGTFEIYVIPGTYDVQVTRLGYLDYIYCDVEVKDGDVVDMGNFNMPAGDANRDSVISQEDMNLLRKVMDMSNTDADFLESYNPSQIGSVSQEDLNYSKANQDKMLTIIYFNKQ